MDTSKKAEFCLFEKVRLSGFIHGLKEKQVFRLTQASEDVRTPLTVSFSEVPTASASSPFKWLFTNLLTTRLKVHTKKAGFQIWTYSCLIHVFGTTGT